MEHRSGRYAATGHSGRRARYSKLATLVIVDQLRVV